MGKFMYLDVAQPSTRAEDVFDAVLRKAQLETQANQAEARLRTAQLEARMQQENLRADRRQRALGEAARREIDRAEIEQRREAAKMTEEGRAERFRGEQAEEKFKRDAMQRAVQALVQGGGVVGGAGAPAGVPAEPAGVEGGLPPSGVTQAAGEFPTSPYAHPVTGERFRESPWAAPEVREAAQEAGAGVQAAMGKEGAARAAAVLQASIGTPTGLVSDVGEALRAQAGRQAAETLGRSKVEIAHATAERKQDVRYMDSAIQKAETAQQASSLLQKAAESGRYEPEDLTRLRSTTTARLQVLQDVRAAKVLRSVQKAGDLAELEKLKAEMDTTDFEPGQIEQISVSLGRKRVELLPREVNYKKSATLRGKVLDAMLRARKTGPMGAFMEGTEGRRYDLANPEDVDAIVGSIESIPLPVMATVEGDIGKLVAAQVADQLGGSEGYVFKLIQRAQAGDTEARLRLMAIGVQVPMAGASTERGIGPAEGGGGTPGYAPPPAEEEDPEIGKMIEDMIGGTGPSGARGPRGAEATRGRLRAGAALEGTEEQGFGQKPPVAAYADALLRSAPIRATGAIGEAIGSITPRPIAVTAKQLSTLLRRPPPPYLEPPYYITPEALKRYSKATGWKP